MAQGDVLRVGVIGLGRRWRKRFRPALRRLRDRYQVRAVYDAIRERTANEARRLRCDAAPALMQLIERTDLEALLLIDPQWFGWWPVEQASRLRTPVLSCPSLSMEEPHADAIRRQVEESGSTVMVAWLPRLAPATARLRELLERELGQPRLVLAERIEPARQGKKAPSGPVLGTAGLALLDWCISLAHRAPVSVLATSSPSARCDAVHLELANGGAAEIRYRHTPVPRSRWRLEITAERGSATIELPHRVAWTLADGRHTECLRGGRTLAQELLARFYHAVRQGGSPKPTLADAHRILGWLRAAQRSCNEGKRVLLAPQSPR